MASFTPYSKTIGSSTGPFYKTIVGVKQDPITNKVLPCETIVSEGSFETNQYPVGKFQPPHSGVIWQQGTVGHNIWPYSAVRTGPRALAYNKARSRFLDKIGLARAQGLTALAERRSTAEMVNNRLLQLAKAAAALRRGNFENFLRTLNVQPLTRHRNKGWNRPREVGGLWLEYWFGWAPTVGDIYSLVDAYTNEINPDYVKAGSKAEAVYSFQGGNGTWKTVTSEDYTCRCDIGALVEITNHDLLDLNEAGLINPAQTALELVPFSWLLGWFVNLSDVLGSFTDTVGLEFQNGWLSEKTSRRCVHTEVNRKTGVPYGFRDYKTVRFKRSEMSNLPMPSLQWVLPTKLSQTRGATLAALITQLFAPRAK